MGHDTVVESGTRLITFSTNTVLLSVSSAHRDDFPPSTMPVLSMTNPGDMDALTNPKLHDAPGCRDLYRSGKPHARREASKGAGIGHLASN
jgi:hypothetical protein